jgi:hypothetical protein
MKYTMSLLQIVFIYILYNIVKIIVPIDTIGTSLVLKLRIGTHIVSKQEWLHALGVPFISEALVVEELLDVCVMYTPQGQSVASPTEEHW